MRIVVQLCFCKGLLKNLIIADIEKPFDDRFFIFIDQYGSVRPFSKYQGERAKYNTFTCAGFAGHRIEVGIRLYGQVVYDRVILYYQLLQHEFV